MICHQSKTSILLTPCFYNLLNSFAVSISVLLGPGELRIKRWFVAIRHFFQRRRNAIRCKKERERKAYEKNRVNLYSSCTFSLLDFLNSFCPCQHNTGSYVPYLHTIEGERWFNSPNEYKGPGINLHSRKGSISVEKSSHLHNLSVLWSRDWTETIVRTPEIFHWKGGTRSQRIKHFILWT